MKKNLKIKESAFKDQTLFSLCILSADLKSSYAYYDLSSKQAKNTKQFLQAFSRYQKDLKKNPHALLDSEPKLRFYEEMYLSFYQNKGMNVLLSCFLAYKLYTKIPYKEFLIFVS